MYDNTSRSNCTHVESSWEELSFLPVPFVAFLLNFLLFLATTLNRKKLERQNYVYVCVISMLLSNVLFILLHVWFIFDTYFETLDRSGETGEGFKTLWTFFQAAIISIQFVMAGNIGSLLFVVLDSTYFVGRSVNKKAAEFAQELKSDANRGSGWSLNVKRRRAVFLIAISWIFPIILTLVATFKWNCDYKCQFCPHGINLPLVCDENTSCSQIWQPLHNDYLSLHAGLWLFEVMGLVILIDYGVREFRRVMAPPQRDLISDSIQDRSSDQLDKKDLSALSPDTASKSSVGEIFSANTNSNNKTSQAESASSSRKNSSKPEPDSALYRKRKQRSVFRLHSRITFMIVLSATFFFCTLPSFVTYILDVSEASVNYEAAMMTAFAAVYLYAIASPLILLKFLPNLKSAVIVMTGKCCSGRPRLHRRQSTHKISKKLQQV